VNLAIVSSHPIQYNAPLFRTLSLRDDLRIKVFYSWEGTANQVDPEFGEKIVWDIPLLEGYDHCFVPNISIDPGSHHFRGLDNPDMLNAVEQWGADAVLVYGWASRTHLRVLRHFHGKRPVYFRGDSTLLTGGNPVRKFLRRLWLSWVYKHVDIAFYPGQRSKEYFLAHGLSEEQLVHVPHSIDTQRFQIDSDEQESCALEQRQALGIPDNALVVLFAGKLVRRKQPELLLRCMLELIPKSDNSVHLIFAGTGPLLDSLKKLAADSANVHFIGFRNQSEMPATYRLGDVFVLPSSIETWGLAVNEAMACGRPVIVSDRVGCAPDLVKPGITGDVFRNGDMEGLKNILMKYINEPENTRLMGKSAMMLISDWSVEKASLDIAKAVVHSDT